MISTMLFRLTILFLFISHSSVYAENSHESIDSKNSHDYDDSKDAPNAPCKDLINCTIYQQYCSKPAYLPQLCQECQQTCDLCTPIGQAICAQYVTPTPPPCKDMLDCSQNAQDCSIPALRSVMCQDCRATCGFCGSRYNDECVAPSNDPTCVDNTDCSGFLNLCKIENNKQTMCSQCKKSCGFCAPNTYCN